MPSQHGLLPTHRTAGGTATRSAAASATASATSSVVAPSTKRGQGQQPHGWQQQQRPERGSLDSAQRRRRWSVVGWSVPAPAPGPPENSAEDELSDVCLRLQQKL